MAACSVALFATIESTACAASRCASGLPPSQRASALPESHAMRDGKPPALARAS